MLTKMGVNLKTCKGRPDIRSWELRKLGLKEGSQCIRQAWAMQTDGFPLRY